jgi:hypothetical protein
MSARLDAWAWGVGGRLVLQRPLRPGTPRDPDMPHKSLSLAIGQTLLRLVDGEAVTYRGRVSVSRRRELLTYYPGGGR